MDTRTGREASGAWHGFQFLVLGLPIALVAFVTTANNLPYMFTRGKPVREDRTFYGCAKAETGCRDEPIPASRYNANRVKYCGDHHLPMDQKMERVSRR